LRITDVQAYATSFPIAPAKRVALGIGTAVKRDAVLVRVATDEGISGWGEAHHGRAHTAVARLIETTLKQLVVGLDPGEMDWPVLERGVKTWLDTGHLKELVREVYDPGTDGLVGRWDLTVIYSYAGDGSR
jgi:L-alanine-DL-glutamate epimerase-like enolase superfamily enzyme